MGYWYNCVIFFPDEDVRQRREAEAKLSRICLRVHEDGRHGEVVAVVAENNHEVEEHLTTMAVHQFAGVVQSQEGDVHYLYQSRL